MSEAIANNIQVNKGDAKQQTVSSIAMTVILISFSMLFATLFLGYAAYRFTSEAWPPMGIERPSLTLPLLSTALIIMSSLTYWRFETLFLKVNEGKTWLMGCFSLGVAFIAAQFALWGDLKNSGLLVETGGIFSSIIYSFTWIHAAHMVAGVMLLGWLLWTIKESSESENYAIRVQNVGKFWHFLGVVWLLMFITIFVF